MSNDISTDVQYIGSYPPRQTKEMKRKLSPPEEKYIPLGNPRFPEASADVNSKHDWLRNDWLNEWRNEWMRNDWLNEWMNEGSHNES